MIYHGKSNSRNRSEVDRFKWENYKVQEKKWCLYKKKKKKKNKRKGDAIIIAKIVLDKKSNVRMQTHLKKDKENLL